VQFTPDFAFVMGGIGDERFKRFEQLCAQAFNVLRKEADLFINLFALVSLFEALEAGLGLFNVFFASFSWTGQP
jgi:hypothetical protein